MKNAIAIAAVAGLASAAAAQTLSLTPSASTVNTNGGATFTITLAAVDFDALGALIGNSNGIGLVNNGTAGAIDGISFALNSIFDGSPAFPPIPGSYDGAESYSGDGFGWNLFAPAPAGVESASDPVIGVYTVSVAAGTVGTLDFTSFQSDAAFLISAGASGFGLTEYQAADVTFGTASVNLVPAPSAMALLGLGGLVAGRRRR